MIHIVIPVFNRWNFTKPCIESLLQQTYTDFKIIVVDHGSSDGTSEFIKKDYSSVILLNGDESMWWTAATNLGVNYALKNDADYVLTLNNDLIVKANYLEELHRISNVYSRAIIGSVSVNISNPRQVIYAGTKWNKWIAKYRNVIDLTMFFDIQKDKEILSTTLLSGRGTLVPIEAFQSVGLFDNVHFPHYAADEDFSLRCSEKGFKLYIATKAIVFIEAEANGLRGNHHKKNKKYWVDIFTSLRSPINLKTRWYWAKKHSPVSLFYFVCDFLRIIYNQLK